MVSVSLPWTPTVVTRRGRYHAAVRWPWAELDPESQYRPDGTFAFPVDETSEPWSPYRLRPPAGELRDGDACEVGNPPMTCYVVRSNRYDPPQDDGFLPRLTESISLLPAGSGHAPASDMGRSEPLHVEVLHRPYAGLREGDLVEDGEGRRLVFLAPFGFYADGRRVRPALPEHPGEVERVAGGQRGPVPGRRRRGTVRRHVTQTRGQRAPVR